LSFALALPAMAAENNAPPDAPSKKTGISFDQRKTQMLKRIDERATKLQEERACVQAAKNDEDLMGCRPRGGPPRGPGGLGGPGGPGPGVPGGPGSPGVPPSKTQ
jgi:hypothetical protein